MEKANVKERMEVNMNKARLMLLNEKQIENIKSKNINVAIIDK